MTAAEILEAIPRAKRLTAFRDLARDPSRSDSELLDAATKWLTLDYPSQQFKNIINTRKKGAEADQQGSNGEGAQEAHLERERSDNFEVESDHLVDTLPYEFRRGFQS